MNCKYFYLVSGSRIYVTKRGTEILQYGEYRFHADQRRSHGGTVTIWRCSLRRMKGCKSIVKTLRNEIFLHTEHQH